jgi:hypothetical protein
MRKLVAWGFSAALLVGLGTSAAKGGDDADGVPPARPAIRWSPWAARVLGIDQRLKPVPKKSTAKAKKDTDKKNVSASKPSPKDDGAALRAREETALLRRLEACDKLTEIATRNNDTVLLHKAEDLNQRAWAAYNQKMGSKGDSASSFESDEAAIERLLGPDAEGRTAASPLRNPDRNAQAAAKEVNP